VYESFPIGRPFGIEVRVHILFLYMMVFLMLIGGNPLGTAAILVTLFGLVLLHELGHSLVARHHGIHVIDIVLWPLGGMARMSEIPESPRVEGQVAIAGPLVNLVLASLGLLALGLLDALGPGPGQSITQIHDGPTAFLMAFTWMNLMLGVFNLVPAFPMDGGRILRAFLARKRSYLEATEIAVRVGRYIALAMIFSVFFIRPMSCALPIVGVYIMWTGMRELWSVRLRHAGGGANPFGPGAGPMGGGPGGFRVDLSEHLRAFGRRGEQGAAPSDSGRGDSSGRSAGGFSDEDLRRLEDEPGPLRRPPQD
jgi:Zn-dependent protease